MIYDGDTGGVAEIFKFTVQKLERLGVSAVIIEDKSGLKQNSLFGTDRKQQLADIDDFCEKLAIGQKAKKHEDFMIISRLESLIAGAGEEEALKRAKAYIEKGGVIFSFFPCCWFRIGFWIWYRTLLLVLQRSGALPFAGTALRVGNAATTSPDDFSLGRRGDDPQQGEIPRRSAVVYGAVQQVRKASAARSGADVVQFVDRRRSPKSGRIDLHPRKPSDSSGI